MSSIVEEFCSMDKIYHSSLLVCNLDLLFVQVVLTLLYCNICC